MSYPKIFRVRQTFERPKVSDIEAKVAAELSRLNLSERVRSGQTVAITAGSRGVANIQVIIRGAANFFRAIGAKPFIVAAMGSHGGGTAEGQRAILEGYGITEEFCDCPIRTSMATVILDQTAEGIPVHFSQDASTADHVLVVGRVKPHTELDGQIQSGLMKMMLIGLGKHEGARVYHRAFQDYPFDQIASSVGRKVIEKGHIVAGLAIVENACDETALIKAVLPNEFEEREKELLTLARRWMPRLPFDHADVLVIDEIGKEISGCGMDTNVVGRKCHEHRAAPQEFPKVKRIIVRSLSEQTHGNATGIGKAEFCLTRAVKAMDNHVTWVNVITSGHPSVGMIPPHYDTDHEVLDAALGTIGLVPRPQAKLLWIRNTLKVVEVECAEAYWTDAKKRDDLNILTDLRPLPFDTSGNLPATMQALTAGSRR